MNTNNTHTHTYTKKTETRTEKLTIEKQSRTIPVRELNTKYYRYYIYNVNNTRV